MRNREDFVLNTAPDGETCVLLVHVPANRIYLSKVNISNFTYFSFAFNVKTCKHETNFLLGITDINRLVVQFT